MTSDAGSAGECDALLAHALTTKLGEDCLEPYIVRTVWAKVTATGTFRPKADDLPDSARYIEYDGSSTGDTGGKSPAHWKINRDCLEVTADALRGIHKDPSRPLQPPPEEGGPASMRDGRDE